MADNVEITAGSGTSVRTDLVGTNHYQVVKLDGGGDGVAVPIVAGQQLKAASLPVVLASDQDALAITAAALPLPSGAATSALQGGGLPAALAANGGLKVEGVAGGVAVPVSLATAPALVAGTAVIGATQDAGPAAGAGTMQTPVHGDMSTAVDLTAAPTAGQKWVITDIIISTAAAAEISIREETSGTVVFGPILMPANGYGQFTPRGKLKLATADKKVQGFSTTADHVTIQVSVVSEA